MATIEEIKKVAEQVRDATQIGENTAERVGGVLVALTDKVKEVDEGSTEGLGEKFDKTNVVQSTGDSTEKVISQKGVTDELAKKLEASKVSQDLGDSTEKVPSQKVVTDNFTELQNAVFPLEVSLSLDKTLLEYTGSEQSIKATYSIKRKGSPITPTALALSVDASLVSIDVKQADTVTLKVNKEGETQIVLTAKHGDLVKSATSKVTMVLPIYYGFGTTETDIAIASNKLSPRLSASGTYAKASAKDDVNFIILAPKTLPKLTNFTMVGAPFVMETSSVSINGKDYYMYKSGAIYMNGTTLNVQAS